MATKKTFTPTLFNGVRKGDPIAYTPFVGIAGTAAYNLALHREAGAGKPNTREWALSDPVSGVMVCRVRAYYKGIPVSSSRLTSKEAVGAAHATFEIVLARNGALKFEQAIAKARAKYSTTNPGAHHETRQ